ncbi:MAG: HNH endonuclease [Sphingorhabdus sp.]
MPITVGDIVNALEALGGEAHYAAITDHILKVAQGPFPAEPQASVRARLQERCSDYKAYLGHVDLFESEQGTGIWRFRKWQNTSPPSSKLDEERENYTAFEGNLVPKSHLVRERDPKLIAIFKSRLTDPRCETCSMSFTEVYGELGTNYIEAHHKLPVSLMADGESTTLDDLAALCANCHRILHKNYPMSVEQLATILAEPGSFTGALEEVRKSRITWSDAVQAAIKRLVETRQSSEFTRQDIIEHELTAITQQVDSRGQTPEQTLSRVLQELRQAEVIEFVDNQGIYRLK